MERETERDLRIPPTRLRFGEKKAFFFTIVYRMYEIHQCLLGERERNGDISRADTGSSPQSSFKALVRYVEILFFFL